MSSCCLRWQIFKHSFYPFAFLKLFSFYFLSSILLEFSEMSIFQKKKCLIKAQLKNCTQTIFQGGSPWATLTLNSMFAVVVFYCVKLLPEVANFQTFLLLFSFAKVFFFYVLSSILLEFSEMSIFHPKKSLIKAQLKNCTQRTFQGVVHQQPWSSIVCLLWGSSIVPSCCLRWQIFKHSFYPVPLLKLFSFTFLAPFLWNHQKCPIPQNIWCLVKTQFKK